MATLAANIPPEKRTVIDKTADFVARNGPAFEHKILSNEKQSATFSFLLPTDPFHAYYKRRIQELKGLLPGQDGAEAASISALPTKKTVAEKEAKPAKPLKAPEPEEWIIDIPELLTALDLEVIKLAAQFVARNGKHFYLGLLNREQRNPQFDFLKPQHYLHRFFNTLVDAYTKVLMPPHDLNTKLDALLDKHKIYEGLLDRVDWEKHQQRLKDEENEEEKERMERALIDWHDFVVVETIVFDDDEMKPPAARAGAAQAGGAERAAVKHEKQDAGDDMDMDVEMEMDLDDQEIRIVKGEAPRPTPSVGTSEALKYSICPKCGEKIPLEDMEEHMRIELLDPIARQKKLEQMKRRRESSLAEGDEISKNLRNLSALRPDIFDEEEEARKAEENRRQQPKIIWDGHTGSIAATASAVMAGMTPEEKAKAIAKAEADRGPKIGPAVSTTQPAAPGPAPGQQPPGPPGQPLLPSPGQLPPGAGAPGQPPRPLGMPGMPPGMPPMGMPPGMPPGMMPYGMPGMPPMPGMAPPGMPPHMQGMPPFGMPPPGYGVPAPGQEEEEPSLKKQKTGPSLVPEEEFIASHPGPVTIKVTVPPASEKGAQPEWNFDGQTLEFSMDPKQTITDLKNLVRDQLGGMPPAKQKLESVGLGFLKDNLSLAAYNMDSNTVIALGVKTRGRGGKK